MGVCVSRGPGLAYTCAVPLTLVDHVHGVHAAAVATHDCGDVRLEDRLERGGVGDAGNPAGTAKWFSNWAQHTSVSGAHVWLDQQKLCPLNFWLCAWAVAMI